MKEDHPQMKETGHIQSPETTEIIEQKTIKTTEPTMVIIIQEETETTTMKMTGTEKKAVKKDENPNDYKIRMAEQKLKGMEDALAKKKQEASSESDPAKKEKLNKVIASISNNIEAAKQTIQDAKSKSNESEDHIFWAIDVMLLTIENQILKKA